MPFEPASQIPDFRGVICAPWPNRLADGRYLWNGKEIQATINEPDRQTALHGLVFERTWKATQRGQTAVTLETSISGENGYPFALDLRVIYSLGEQGLVGTVTARNPGATPIPYGVCPHPYLVAGPSPLNDWTVVIPADRFLNVTPDRLLPTDDVPVDEHDFDFRQEKNLEHRKSTTPSPASSGTVTGRQESPHSTHPGPVSS